MKWIALLIALIAPSQAWGAWALVGTCQTGAGGANNVVTTNAPAGTAAGNILVFDIAWYTGAGGTISINNGVGPAIASEIDGASNSVDNTYVYQLTAPAAATYTATGSNAGNQYYMTAIVCAFS